MGTLTSFTMSTVDGSQERTQPRVRFPDRCWRRVTDRYPRGDGTDPGQQPSIGIGTVREALLPPHVRQNQRMRSS